MAEDHKDWAQVWFSISTSLFILGILYAAFHFGEAICPSWTPKDSSDPWEIVAGRILPNIFAYSLFFVAWRWATGHFRAHWHNFITNAYRHRAIEKLRDAETRDLNLLGERGPETVKDLRILSALLLMLPAETAYTEKETEGSSAERIVKLEELLREFVTSKGR